MFLGLKIMTKITCQIGNIIIILFPWTILSIVCLSCFMKQKSAFMSLIAILSLTVAFAPTLIDDVSALKSALEIHY